jgi:dGTPase
METLDFKPFANVLAAKAFDSSRSRGRRHPILSDDDDAYINILDPFLLDREKIRLSKFFRRLADKTQVFMNHRENGHVRNRKIHTDEVASLAVQISSILGLNVFLTEASAFGHDLGHTPFGHAGERVISELSGQKFRHEIMSVVVAQKIERSGKGLNLSYETLEGILNHSRGGNGLHINPDLPLEHGVVMLADKIAYTFSDLNDALRCAYFTKSQLPKELQALGNNQRERWLNCVYALVKESSEEGTVSFHKSEIAQQFETLRQWSYANFYGQLDRDFQRQQAAADLKSVYDFLNAWMTQFGYDPFFILALLTDQEAKNISVFSRFYTIGDITAIEKYSFMEIMNSLPKDHKIDIFNADLNPESFRKTSL